MGRIAILGAGSWGTALGNHLRWAGHEVCFWGIEAAVLDDLRQGHNQKYFPETDLQAGMLAEEDIYKAVQAADLVIFAVPSVAMRETAAKLKGRLSEGALVVNVSKGLEKGSLKRMSQVLEDELGESCRIGVLSGPSFAKEVIQYRPTAVTVASKDAEVAKEIAGFFHFNSFRVYTSTDVVGVELGGALKNVIAVACGIVDGSNQGLNGRAALITRGLKEIQKIAQAQGAQPETISGLSGLGDLLLTSTGDLSRNRRVGLALGQGKKLPEILQELGQVAEGVETAPHVLALAEKLGVEAPITAEVVKIIRGESSIAESGKRLFSREAVQEF